MINKSFFPLLIMLFGALLMPACSQKQVVLEDVNEYGLQPNVYTYKNIPVYYARNKIKLTKKLTIYIEGDGRPWITRKRVSADPTPSNSLVLKLMQKDNNPAVYLARPCMYTQTSFCENYYWTEGRHHPKLVAAMNATLDYIKQLYDVSAFEFVGHSGGGAMAVLMAADRSDVKRITTIAGNLDIAFFTDYHRVTKMKGSLNPSDFIHKVDHIPQLHLTGAEDEVVPPELTKSYMQKTDSPCVAHKVYKSFEHFDGWVFVWPQVLNNMPKC